MVSGQWNRETVKALWQLTSRYWRSEEKKSAWMYLVGIIILTMAAVYMTLRGCQEFCVFRLTNRI